MEKLKPRKKQASPFLLFRMRSYSFLLELAPSVQLSSAPVRSASGALPPGGLIEEVEGEASNRQSRNGMDPIGTHWIGSTSREHVTLP